MTARKRKITIPPVDPKLTDVTPEGTGWLTIDKVVGVKLEKDGEVYFKSKQLWLHDADRLNVQGFVFQSGKNPAFFMSTHGEQLKKVTHYKLTD